MAKREADMSGLCFQSVDLLTINFLQTLRTWPGVFDAGKRDLPQELDEKRERRKAQGTTRYYKVMEKSGSAAFTFRR